MDQFQKILKVNKSDYSTTYFKERDQLDVQHAQYIKIFLESYSLTKVLDVGCGTGRLVKFLNQQGYQTQGCEPETAALKIARKINSSKSIKKASAISLPYKTESCDLIISTSVIEHLTKKETKAFLKEAKRVLKLHGYIFIISPNFSSPFRYIKKEKWFAFSDPTHINYYTPKSIKLLLTSSGFNNISFQFKTAYDKSLDQTLPKSLQRMPRIIKKSLFFLMFSTPLSILRDSLWVSAQK